MHRNNTPPISGIALPSEVANQKALEMQQQLQNAALRMGGASEIMGKLMGVAYADALDQGRTKVMLRIKEKIKAEMGDGYCDEEELRQKTVEAYNNQAASGSVDPDDFTLNINLGQLADISVQAAECLAARLSYPAEFDRFKPTPETAA